MNLILLENVIKLHECQNVEVKLPPLSFEIILASTLDSKKAKMWFTQVFLDLNVKKLNDHKSQRNAAMIKSFHGNP